MMTKRAWTEPEISQAKQMEMLGFTFREIGLKLGRPRSSVVHILRPRVKTSQCVDCAVPVFAGSKTGRCRRCKNTWLGSNEDFRQARAEGVRRKWSDDPVFASRMRLLFSEIGKENGTDPVRRAKLVEHGHRMKAVLQLPENVAKRDYAKVSATLRERRIGWCPQEYRADYRYLTHNKGLRAHEAKAIILGQIKADREREQLTRQRARDSLSPFERQQLGLERGAQLVANDRKPSLANPGIYEERRVG